MSIIIAKFKCHKCRNTFECDIEIDSCPYCKCKDVEYIKIIKEIEK